MVFLSRTDEELSTLVACIPRLLLQGMQLQKLPNIMVDLFRSGVVVVSVPLGFRDLDGNAFLLNGAARLNDFVHQDVCSFRKRYSRIELRTTKNESTHRRAD